MYICTYGTYVYIVNQYVCTYTYTYICIFVISKSIDIDVRIYLCIRMCGCIYAYVCTVMYVYVYIYIYMHIYMIYVCIYISIFIYVDMDPLGCIAEDPSLAARGHILLLALPAFKGWTDAADRLAALCTAPAQLLLALLGSVAGLM